MKKLLFAAMMLMPLAAMAQDNTWEQTEKKTTEDTRYLAGAVPEVDGRVVFETTIQAPGKSAKQIFTLLRDDMQKMTKEPNQIEQSRINIEDEEKGEVVGTYQEWLVFKNKPLVLDRTRFFYTIQVECKAGEAKVKLSASGSPGCCLCWPHGSYRCSGRRRPPRTLSHAPWSAAAQSPVVRSSCPDTHPPTRIGSAPHTSGKSLHAVSAARKSAPAGRRSPLR